MERDNFLMSKVLETAEKLGWVVTENGYNIMFSQFSPAGQDFNIEVEKKDGDVEGFIENIYEYWENYDVSEETALWIDMDGHGKNGAPYEIEDIVEDMKECESMIEKLYQGLRKTYDELTEMYPGIEEYEEILECKDAEELLRNLPMDVIGNINTWLQISHDNEWSDDYEDDIPEEGTIHKKAYDLSEKWVSGQMQTSNFINQIQELYDCQGYKGKEAENKKTFKIPVVYQSWGLVEVEAKSLKEAVKYAEDNLAELPLPDEPAYVEDSYEIDYEGIEIHNSQNIDVRKEKLDEMIHHINEQRNNENKDNHMISKQDILDLIQRQMNHSDDIIRNNEWEDVEFSSDSRDFEEGYQQALRDIKSFLGLDKAKNKEEEKIAGER